MEEDTEVPHRSVGGEDGSECLPPADKIGPETRSAVSLLMTLAYVVGAFSFLSMIAGAFALVGAGPFYGSTSWVGGLLMLLGAAGAVGARLLGALSGALEELAKRQAAMLPARERRY